jgi:hypothetical protein
MTSPDSPRSSGSLPEERAFESVVDEFDDHLGGLNAFDDLLAATTRPNRLDNSRRHGSAHPPPARLYVGKGFRNIVFGKLFGRKDLF